MTLLNEAQYYLLAFVFFWGIINKVWRKGTKENDVAGLGNKTLNEAELNFRMVKNRIDWIAYEAEVANLRSEAIIRKLSELESEISKIKNYVATALEVSVELDRKLKERVIVDKKLVNKFKGTYQNEEQDKVEVPIKGRKFSSTEEQVIELLSLSEGMVAKDIQIKLNMSREHISRLLGRLVDKGLLLRSRKGRQFVYQLSQKNQQ